MKVHRQADKLVCQLAYNFSYREQDGYNCMLCKVNNFFHVASWPYAFQQLFGHLMRLGGHVEWFTVLFCGELGLI